MMTPQNFHTGNPPADAPQYYAASSTLAPGSAMAMGAVGAVVGAVSATAASLPQIRGQEPGRQEAMLTIAKEAAGTGLATAAGGAAARALGMRGFVGLLGMFAVATGVKYFWNQAMDSRAAVEEKPAEAPAKPKKAAKK